MTIERLRQLIVSEANIPQALANQLKGQVFSIIVEEARLITATIRLPDYFESDASRPFTTQERIDLRQGISIPFQHIDPKSIRYFPDGDSTSLDYATLYRRMNFAGPNSGPPRFYYIKNNFLYLYPYAEVTIGTSQIFFNGWTYPLFDGDWIGDNLDTEIADQLAILLRQRVLARVAPYSNPKTAATFLSRSRETKTELLGEWPISDANGEK